MSFPGGNDSNAVLLLALDNNFTDGSVGGSGHTISNNGTSFSTTAKFGTHSCEFDSASSEYFTVPSSSDFNFFDSSYTIDFWFNQAADMGSGTYGYFVLGADNNDCLYCLVDNKRLDMVIRNSASTVVDLTPGEITGDWNPSAGWHHFAVVRDDSTDTYYVFLDGVKRNEVVDSDQIENANQPIDFGRHPSLGGYYYTGKIDEIRVSNTARWTADFTPPTAAYGSGLYYKNAGGEEIEIHGM